MTPHITDEGRPLLEDSDSTRGDTAQKDVQLNVNLTVILRLRSGQVFEERLLRYPNKVRAKSRLG